MYNNNEQLNRSQAVESLLPHPSQEDEGASAGSSPGQWDEQAPLAPKSESSFSIKPASIRERRPKYNKDDDFVAASGEPVLFENKYSTFDGMSDEKFADGSAQKKLNALRQSQPAMVKMGTTKTFFAVMKAYCAINVLLLPRSFVNGGYLLSPLAMMVAFFFESLCAVRLTNVANSQGIFSYPLLMEKALGTKGLWISRICLGLAHWQFTVGQMTFTLQSLQSTFGAWFGTTWPLWVFGICIWLLYTPLVWVRRMENFSKGFIFAVAMILLGVLTTTVFAFRIIEEQDGPGPDYVPINMGSYYAMIGFAFFMFEGIGCLLPVARETERPEQLPIITVAAIATLCLVYVLFSTLCYYAWGEGLDQPVVTEMLPADNTFVQVMKLLFCINLVFSYPLTIVPTFNSFEVLLGKPETNTEEQEFQEPVQNQDRDGAPVDETQSQQSAPQSSGSTQSQWMGESTALYWKINAMRSVVVLFTMIIVCKVSENLDKFMSVMGTIFGMTNVLMLPAICHLKLVANTRNQKIFDIAIIVFASIMLVFGPSTIIMQWKNEE